MKKLSGLLLTSFLLASTASAGEWSWLGQSAIWTAGNVITNRQSEKEATKRAEIYANVQHHDIEARAKVEKARIAAEVLMSGSAGTATAGDVTVTSQQSNNTNRGQTASGYSQRRP